LYDLGLAVGNSARVRLACPEDGERDDRSGAGLLDHEVAHVGLASAVDAADPQGDQVLFATSRKDACGLRRHAGGIARPDPIEPAHVGRQHRRAGTEGCAVVLLSKVEELPKEGGRVADPGSGVRRPVVPGDRDPSRHGASAHDSSHRDGAYGRHQSRCCPLHTVQLGGWPVGVEAGMTKMTCRAWSLLRAAPCQIVAQCAWSS